MTDPDALEAAKLITGKVRLIGDGLHVDDPEPMHERIDALLLNLLQKDYPETVEYVRKLRLWYG